MRIHVTIADLEAPWDLSLERFAERLTADWPDTTARVEQDDKADFWWTRGDEDAEGVYYIGRWQQLVCREGRDATIEDWAPLIEWFLGLLPDGAGVEIFLDAVAIPQPLPRSSTAGDIARILNDLNNSV